jgi:aspartyl-tRNA(Asn)/glutamyl-tRNA(Gln) amidotransferase subunit C
MKATRETVLHVAALASLSLDDDEVTALATDLAAIVQYVEQLSAVDTEGLAPTPFTPAAASLRPDEPRSGLTREEALAQAPRAVDGGFAVPPFASALGRS